MAAHRAHAWHRDSVPETTPAQRQRRGAGAAGTANTAGVKVLGDGADSARDGDGDGTGAGCRDSPVAQGHGEKCGFPARRARWHCGSPRQRALSCACSSLCHALGRARVWHGGAVMVGQLGGLAQQGPFQGSPPSKTPPVHWGATASLSPPWHIHDLQPSHPCRWGN